MTMARPRFRRGTWRPEQTNGGVLAIQLAALGTCATRGIDYLRPDVDPASVLSRVQDTAPLSIWGAVFLTATIVVLIGMVGRWPTVIGFGHLIAMLMYAGIAYGLLQVTGFGPGVRTPAGLAGAAIFHAALGIGTFAVQRRHEELEHPSDVR